MTGADLEFSLALLLFLFSHSVLAKPALKARLINQFGPRVFLVGYILLSMVLLAYVFATALHAPRHELWYLESSHGLPLLLMLISCILLMSAVTISNPLSIGRQGQGGMPTPLPLLLALTRHPALWGFFIWSAVHLLTNGEYPMVVMFLVFAVLAFGGCFLIDRKKQRQYGPGWHKLAQDTHWLLGASPALWRKRFRVTSGDGWAVVGGLLLYGVMLSLHEAWIGMSPYPPET